MAYKYNIIFNSAEQSRGNPTEDTVLAADFADKLEEKMKSYGYEGYNPDNHATLGSSTMKEIFRIVQETDYTIVIVTPDFKDDYWAEFKKESAYNYLIRRGKRHKVIPIGVETTELQELDINYPLFFLNRESWEREGKWRRLKNIFDEGQHPDESLPVEPSQAYGDNRLRTDQQNIVTRPVSAASSMASFDGSLDSQITSMDSLHLAGQIPYIEETRDGATSADVSMDGIRSVSAPQQRAMVSHHNDDATTADNNLSETPPLIDHQPENAPVLNSTPELPVERGTATYDSDQLNDDDLDIDAQQSPTLAASAPSDEEMPNMLHSESNLTTDNIQNQESVRSIPGLDCENKPEEASGFSLKNIGRRLLGTFFKGITGGDKAFN